MWSVRFLMPWRTLESMVIVRRVFLTVPISGVITLKEALVIALDLKGLAVSSGAACSSGAIEPSHVLLAMGLPHQRARASIRVSLGKQTTQDDIDFAGKIIPETVAQLREISPAYQKQTVG